LFHWPCAFAVICRCGAAATSGDASRASVTEQEPVRQTHRSAVRPPGRQEPSTLVRKGDGHHHHRTRRADRGHGRGRYPWRCPGRLRHRPARPQSGRHAGLDHPGGLSTVAGLGPRSWPGRGVRGRRYWLLWAGLARFLDSHGQTVLEVNRPDRSARRRRGKSDPVDAEAAARAVQAGEASAVPKAGDGAVEMIRVLGVARASAVKARSQPPMPWGRCWSPLRPSSASSFAGCRPTGWPRQRHGCARDRS
jgi:hypothetical protein